LWAEWGGDESWFNLMTTRDGLAWSEPVRLLAGKGARVLPWIATPAAGEIGIAWYGADGASDPESGARDWFAYYAKVVEADGTSPRVQAQKVSDASLHRGVVCPRGPLCPGGTRQLLDYTGIDYDAEGRARLAFAATVGHGLQSPRFGHPVAFAQT
jgi:hypothetical protein